nr:hypothetical protein [uncultured Anaerosporobacter sp.]
MKSLENYECEGQLELNDFLRSKITNGKVKDLTNWINSQGKSQYAQIGEVISTTYEQEKDTNELIGRLTNAVSVYVLNQSIGYMKYLKNESEL